MHGASTYGVFDVDVKDHETMQRVTDGSETLGDQGVVASAPLRIDCGGTWDLVPLALPYHAEKPLTVNIALSSRVEVYATAYEPGLVRVESTGFKAEEIPLEDASFSSPLGAYFFVCRLFGITGILLRVQSDSPPRGGLGGSAAGLVAAIGALDLIKPILHHSMGAHEIAMLANRVESSMYVCGLQDHLVAVYGGANSWYWQFHSADTPYRRCELLKGDDLQELNECIVIAFTGHPKDSSVVTAKHVEHFLLGEKRKEWLALNHTVHSFAEAVSKKIWAEAARCLREEFNLRSCICPEASTDEILRFTSVAETLGCGARYTGAGSGGCVWAIGPPKEVSKLKFAWGELAKEIPRARLLPYSVSELGLLACYA